MQLSHPGAPECPRGAARCLEYISRTGLNGEFIRGLDLLIFRAQPGENPPRLGLRSRSVENTAAHGDLPRIDADHASAAATEIDLSIRSASGSALDMTQLPGHLQAPDRQAIGEAEACQGAGDILVHPLPDHDEPGSYGRRGRHRETQRRWAVGPADPVLQTVLNTNRDNLGSVEGAESRQDEPTG